MLLVSYINIDSKPFISFEYKKSEEYSLVKAKDISSLIITVFDFNKDGNQVKNFNYWESFFEKHFLKVILWPVSIESRIEIMAKKYQNAQLKKYHATTNDGYATP